MDGQEKAATWLEAALGDWLFVGSGRGPWYAAHKRQVGVRLGPFDTIQDTLKAAFLYNNKEVQGAEPE